MSKLLDILNLKKYFEKNNESNIPEEIQDVGFLSFEQKQKLEVIIGLKINNIEIFTQAITHRSYMHCVRKDQNIVSNERLEFLGDSILGMVVASHLFETYPEHHEGELTRLRSLYVKKSALAGAAKYLEIENFLLLSHAALKSVSNGGDSIIADAIEALIAAIYIDSGFESARKFILNKLLPIIKNQERIENSNYKSILLENVQADGKPSPIYNVLEEEGPPHNKTFKIGVYVENELVGTGVGKSKKTAEQDAAHEALKNHFSYKNN